MKNVEKVMAMNNKNQKMETYEGGVGYKTSFKETLAEFFSLGLLNGNFYQSSEEVLKNAKDIFEKALVECPEFATKCAIYGNNVNSLKLVPTVWLVYLSTLENKRLFKVAFPRIIRNPKMLHDFMEIARKGGIREGLGRGVKKTINDWLTARLNEYQVSRNKGKLSEIVKVTRPANSDEMFQSYMRYLSKDELSFPRAKALKEVLDFLEKGELGDTVLKQIEANQLQLEELKHSTQNLSAEDKQKLYSSMYKGLNYSALILNLVALERVFATKTDKVWKYTKKGTFQQTVVVETDIPQNVIDMVVAKINDVEMYRKSNMLPFALFSAERMVVTPEFKSAIANLLRKVAGDAFTIDKEIRLMVGVDTSGSMTSNAITDSLTASDISCMFGSLIKKSHTNSEVYAVATHMKHVPVAKQDDVFEMSRQIAMTEVGAGTYFEQIMKHYNGEKYIILITDSEQADNLEMVWLKTQKPEGAKLLIWQLAPYQTKISSHPSVVYLAGYSDRLLGLVKNIIEGKSGQIEEIEKIVL